MSTEAKLPAVNPLEDLAAEIYVELVGRAFLRAENAAVIKPEPAVLAKLSFDLAESFMKVQAVVREASGPKNVGYDIQMSDVANWQKP